MLTEQHTTQRTPALDRPGSTDIERVLNDRGLTLGVHADMAENLSDTLASAWIRDILTEPEYRRAQQRLAAWITRSARPIVEVVA